MKLSLNSPREIKHDARGVTYTEIRPTFVCRLHRMDVSVPQGHGSPYTLRTIQAVVGELAQQVIVARTDHLELTWYKEQTPSSCPQTSTHTAWHNVCNKVVAVTKVSSRRDSCFFGFLWLLVFLGMGKLENQEDGS